MSEPPLVLATIVSDMFAENAYVANLPGRSDCLVVDPGLNPDRIIDYLFSRRLTPAAILITHGHTDHIAGNEALRRVWPSCPIVIGHGDAPKLTDPMLNLSGQYGIPITSPPAETLLHEGDPCEAAGFLLEVRETPGHSSGHVVFIWKGATPWIVFGGDVLFQGGVGRTDFPDGSFEQLAASIRDKLFTLPDDTIVLPGHGDPTTIGEEKEQNPFVGRRRFH